MGVSHPDRACTPPWVPACLCTPVHACARLCAPVCACVRAFLYAVCTWCRRGVGVVCHTFFLSLSAVWALAGRWVVAAGWWCASGSYLFSAGVCTTFFAAADACLSCFFFAFCISLFVSLCYRYVIAILSLLLSISMTIKNGI